MGVRVYKKVPFTLLEILVALVILAAVGSAVAINVRRMVFQQRFHSEADQLLQVVRTAQELMRLGYDVAVRIYPLEDAKWHVDLLIEGGIPKGWKQLLSRQRHAFTALQIVWRPQGKLPAPGLIQIDFLSRGSVMSRGILELAGGEETQGLCLHGYPAPIALMAMADAYKCLESDMQWQTAREQLGRFIRQEIEHKEGGHASAESPSK